MQTEQDAEIKWLNSEVLDLTLKLQICRDFLSGLVSLLLRSYEDDLWTSNTREVLDDIVAYLGEQPIMWNLAEDEHDEHQ